MSNELVIVVPADSTLEINSPADLAGDKIRHVALADPQAVPAGIYARQALAKLDLWKAIEPKATGSADVRQALVAVETGAAEAGIVYATDAAASKRVRVACAHRSQAFRSDPLSRRAARRRREESGRAGFLRVFVLARRGRRLSPFRICRAAAVGSTQAVKFAAWAF